MLRWAGGTFLIVLAAALWTGRDPLARASGSLPWYVSFLGPYRYARSVISLLAVVFSLVGVLVLVGVIQLGDP